MSNGDGLPTGWAQATLGEVLRIIRGVSYKKDQACNSRDEGLIPILRATNIDRKLHFTDFVYVPRSCVSDEQLLREKDIVIAASSGSRHVVGKAAQLTEPWEGSFGAFCMGLRVTTQMCRQFVGYFLQSDEYRNEVSRLSAGININNLRRQHIETLKLRVAPLNEQRRIVAKIEELFSDLDAGVAALERAKANLKRYRAAVLKAAVEGRLTEQWRAENPASEPAPELLERILAERRKKWEEQQLAAYEAKGKKPPKNWRDKYKELATPDTTKLPPLPKGWCWVTTEQLLIEKSCNGISVKGSYVPPGIPALRLSAMSESGFDYSDRRYIPISNRIAESLAVRAGDFFVSRGNGSIHLVGRGTLAQEPKERIVFPDTMIRLRFGGLAVLRRFISLAWQSRLIRKQVESKARTTAGIYKISQRDVDAFVVPLPPLAEQEQIVVLFDRLASITDQSQSQMASNLRRSARLRQSILKRAFEGKLVPQDRTDEPADKLVERIASARQTALSKESRKAQRNICKRR